jgi:hypothetical protein
MLLSTGKDQKIQLNYVKLYAKILLNGSWLVEKGLFEHKRTLDFILLTFVHAKLTKFKPAFVQTCDKFHQYSTKDFLNSNFQF